MYFWIQNLQRNISLIPVDRLGLDKYATLSAGDEAPFVVADDCVILQKSMDSTGAETQGEILFNFVIHVCFTVTRGCDTAQIRHIKSMGYSPTRFFQVIHMINVPRLKTHI